METFTSFFQKQIDELKNSIKVSTESVVTQMKSILNDSISEVDSRVVDLERKEQELDERVSQSELLINKFNSDLTEEVELLRKKANEAIIIANDNEQYSRLRNIRIRGWKQEADVSCPETVLKFIKNKLKMKDITSNDIEAAHPLPSTGTASNTTRSTVPTILVKFSRKSTRQKVMEQRKCLKGSGISVVEDLTGLNTELLNRLNNSDRVLNSWSWNGKVYAVMEGQTDRIMVKPFTPLEDLLNK